MSSVGDAPVPAPQRSRSDADVLDCWKDIAAYLQRDVRTVMRWEHARGLPIHRLPGGPKPAVYALKSELDAWRLARPEPRIGRTLRRHVATISLVVALLVAGGVALHFAWKMRGAAPSPIRSLAVLPFENISRDPAQDYFADGVHDALITDLARDSGIRVISRTSVAQYRGARMPARRIARELGVDALVEGSVLRVGGRVRVTAQLVRAETDEHLWADTYDWDVGDVLGSMSELSAAITRRVRSAVAGDQRQAAPFRTLRPDAIDAYLRAQYSFHLLTREGFHQALSLYREAIEIDPAFAHAWRGLAATRTSQAFFGYSAAGEVLPEAREAARRALLLDERMGEAHGILGAIALYWDWDFDTAGKRLKRAVQLSPNSTGVRHNYADYLLVLGSAEESLEHARLGRANDPASWPARRVFLYHTLMARHYDEAIVEGRQMVAAPSVHPIVHDYLARALWLRGEHRDALAEWRAALPSGDADFRAVEEAYVRGGPEAALLARADWTAVRARTGLEPAIQVASCFALAGDADRAFEWLEQSYVRREPFLLHVVADPFFDRIRTDPRFSDLLRRIGITAGPR